MKKTTLAILLLSILVLSISVNSLPASAKVCKISGRVLQLYPSLAPPAVEGAIVHCKNIGGSYNETRITDENGNYTFENVPVYLLPHKLYFIYVAKEGYFPCPLPKPLTGFALIRVGILDNFIPLTPPLFLVKKLS